MKPGKELLYLALGGSGEIGMNVSLYGCDGKWLMVDCGVSFPDPAFYPGTEVILPDLAFIEERQGDLVGLLLTHGHEDHIGAIPYLAADLKVPLFATRFTAGLIAEKLAEEGLRDVDMRTVDIGGHIDLHPFSVDFVPLAHSIPEMHGLVIKTAYGNVFHTGDWKLDNAPQVGVTTTDDDMRKIGDEGILALVCDSTNVFNSEAAGSEATVRGGLEDCVAAAKGRVVVTTFASNAARLHTLGRVARATNRQLCVAGRSLERILRIAKASGYLADFPPTVDFETAMGLPRNEMMIIATGGQGEPRAALARIAFDTHPIKLDAGDTVIYSSKQIPGNEVAIGRIMNALARADIITITERQAHVHVSGHPGQPELAAMYRWIRPEILIPVHGESRHLHAHQRFALDQGVPKSMVQENGELIRLAPKGPAKIGDARVGRLILDGDIIIGSDGVTMNQRRKIAADGSLAVAVALNSKRAQVGEIRVGFEGLPIEDDRAAFIDACEAAIAGAVTKGAADEDRLREAVRLAARRIATEWTGKKPVVTVLFIPV